ncbi:hypothetical protein ACFL3E_00330 [Patescibacteria group bacterium]
MAEKEDQADQALFSEEEARSIDLIRKTIEKGLMPRSEIYIPPFSVSTCAVCGSPNICNSPEGITCGDRLCRDNAPHLIQSLLDFVDPKERNSDAPTLNDVEAIIDRLKKAESDNESLMDSVKRAYQALKGILPDDKSSPMFGVLNSIIDELEVDSVIETLKRSG